MCELINIVTKYLMILMFLLVQKKKQREQTESVPKTSMRKSKSTEHIAHGNVHQHNTCTIHLFTVGISINTPPTVQPDIPTIQTSLVETPDETSINSPFLSAGVTSNNLHVKQTMTKARSMVRKCVTVSKEQCFFLSSCNMV